MSDTYQKAGVNIDVGNAFVERIRPFVQKTRRSGVLRDIGGYGGFFQPNLTDIKEPVLVSSTDGVGTKLRLAIDLKRYDTIGIDLVAMCINDIACSGAEPLFFLDYLATGHLDPDIHAEIVRGIAHACEEMNCALIGGETAEMPGCYQGTDFDLAGFAVGIVDRKRIVDGSAIRVGQSIVGIASSGFHSNGFSLVRRIVEDQKLDLNLPLPGERKKLGDMLLTPTKLYSTVVLSLLKEFHIEGIAHITGGGFWDNVPRILPRGVSAVISPSSWEWPSIMRFFQHAGAIDDAEMLRVFNCGIGMVLIVPAHEAEEVCHRIAGFGEKAYCIGHIEAREGKSPTVRME